MRWLALVIVVVAHTASADTCLSVSDALARQGKANEQSEANLTAALKKQKLERIKLVEHTIDSQYPKLDKPDTWAGRPVMIVGAASTCGGAKLELVRRGDKIYRLVRTPKYKQQQLAACDCYFAPYTCGGAAPRTFAIGVEIPADASYGGAITIDYDAIDVQVSFGVAAKHACVPPPPPP